MRITPKDVEVTFDLEPEDVSDADLMRFVEEARRRNLILPAHIPSHDAGRLQIAIQGALKHLVHQEPSAALLELAPFVSEEIQRLAIAGRIAHNRAAVGFDKPAPRQRHAHSNYGARNEPQPPNGWNRNKNPGE